VHTPATADGRTYNRTPRRRKDHTRSSLNHCRRHRRSSSIGVRARYRGRPFSARTPAPPSLPRPGGRRPDGRRHFSV